MMGIVADFECKNVPMRIIDSTSENDFMKKLSVNKPVAIRYYLVKNPDYDLLIIEKEGYFKYFVKDFLNVL